MRIGDREISHRRPPYVIAEIGVNHDGSVERAIGLVDDAAAAGADAVKLQLFQTDLLMSKAAKLAAYQAAAGETDPLAMLRHLELSVEQMGPIVERAHARGLHAIVTVFSVELVARAETLPWDAYKSASPDIVNRPLLEAMASTGRPLIVSTGASTMDEVARAVGWLGGARERLALLQCVSCYPVPEGQDGLGGIAALREQFGGIPVGYSDHTDSVDTAWLAVACGACMLEKHLTYDRSAVGPDHAASADVTQFIQYVTNARLRWMEPRGVTHYTPTGVVPSPTRYTISVERAPEKRVLDCERDVRGVSRQSLTTARSLPAGHTLLASDLTVKRPGAGLEPWRLGAVVGRSLAHAVGEDMPLTEHDLV